MNKREKGNNEALINEIERILAQIEKDGDENHDVAKESLEHFRRLYEENIQKRVASER